MTIRPIYKKLLVLTIVAYVIWTAIAITDLYNTVGKMKHTLMHLSEKHQHE